MTEIYRTPDERFEELPGYDFEPHYAQVGGLRLHYVDTGPPTPDAGRGSCTASRRGRTCGAR